MSHRIPNTSEYPLPFLSVPKEDLNPQYEQEWIDSGLPIPPAAMLHPDSVMGQEARRREGLAVEEEVDDNGK